MELKDGEYYLGRIYIHPEYQNRGIARDAILLCEKEFPDARCYYVDFPEDMEEEGEGPSHLSHINLTVDELRHT